MSVFDPSQPASIKDVIWILLNLRRGAFFQRPDIGSDLHLLRQTVLSPGTLSRASAMVRRALSILVNQGRIQADSLQISVVAETPTKLRINVSAQAANGTLVELSTFVPVGVIPS